jgi:hypothetical protein
MIYRIASNVKIRYKVYTWQGEPSFSLSASKVDKTEVVTEDLETGRLFRKDVQHAMYFSGAIYLC